MSCHDLPLHFLVYLRYHFAFLSRPSVKRPWSTCGTVASSPICPTWSDPFALSIAAFLFASGTMHQAQLLTVTLSYPYAPESEDFDVLVACSTFSVSCLVRLLHSAGYTPASWFGARTIHRRRLSMTTRSYHSAPKKQASKMLAACWISGVSCLVLGCSPVWNCNRLRRRQSVL